MWNLFPKLVDGISLWTSSSLTGSFHSLQCKFFLTPCTVKSLNFQTAETVALSSKNTSLFLIYDCNSLVLTLITNPSQKWLRVSASAIENWREACKRASRWLEWCYRKFRAMRTYCVACVQINELIMNKWNCMDAWIYAWKDAWMDTWMDAWMDA